MVEGRLTRLTRLISVELQEPEGVALGGSWLLIILAYKGIRYRQEFTPT